MSMRNKWILLILVGAGAAFTVYRQGMAAGQELIAPARIGVVDVTTILENSKKHRQWQEKMREEETKMRTELQDMREELKKLEGQMSVLKRGSSDYFAGMNQYSQKKAIYEARNAFYEEKITTEMQQWTEKLYTEFLAVVEKTAAEMSLDMVLADEPLEVPAPSLRDFMLTVKTRKVLFHRQTLDITEEVMRRLDASE